MLASVSNKSAITSIIVVSIGVILFLFWLIYFKSTPTETTLDMSFLPTFNAICNGLSALCIGLGVWAIKNQKREVHKKFMLSALGFSAMFLVSYITYYSVHGNTIFQGQGIIRPIYFFILITHIVLSAVMLPMIFTTFFFAFSERFPRHRKLARITYPIWLYVSITGILVYLIVRAYH